MAGREQKSPWGRTGACHCLAAGDSREQLVLAKPLPCFLSTNKCQACLWSRVSLSHPMSCWPPNKEPLWALLLAAHSSCGCLLVSPALQSAADPALVPLDMVMVPAPGLGVDSSQVCPITFPSWESTSPALCISHVLIPTYRRKTSS